MPRGLAVANAAKLFQLLEDLVLAGEGGGGVEGELLQVVRDPARERHLVPAHQQKPGDQQQLGRRRECMHSAVIPRLQQVM